MLKLHSKRVEKMLNYTWNEWEDVKTTLETSGEHVKTTLETSGEDFKTGYMFLFFPLFLYADKGRTKDRHRFYPS